MCDSCVTHHPQPQKLKPASSLPAGRESKFLKVRSYGIVTVDWVERRFSVF
jgi:hypothetical protein